MRRKDSVEIAAMGALMNVPFSRPVSFPELDRMARYLNDVLEGQVSLDYSSTTTYQKPVPPRVPTEPRRSYAARRSESVKITLHSPKGETIILEAQEKSSAQRITFTGLELQTFGAMTKQQALSVLECKRCLADYFTDYKK